MYIASTVSNRLLAPCMTATTSQAHIRQLQKLFAHVDVEPLGHAEVSVFHIWFCSATRWLRSSPCLSHSLEINARCCAIGCRANDLRGIQHCHVIPKNELPGVLPALDARVSTRGTGGRSANLSFLFLCVFQNVLVEWGEVKHQLKVLVSFFVNETS